MGMRDQDRPAGLVGNDHAGTGVAVEIAEEGNAGHQVATPSSRVISISALSAVGTIERIWQALPA